MTRLVQTLLPVARQYDMTLKSVHRGIAHDGSRGTISIDDNNRTGVAAPISPFSTADPVWELFAGTARGVWASATHDEGESEELVVTPFIATGVRKSYEDG